LERGIEWVPPLKGGKPRVPVVAITGQRNALMEAGYTMPLKLKATAYPEQGIIHAKLPDKPGEGNTKCHKGATAAGHYSW